MEDITDADYMHSKRVCKDLETKTFGEYHDLCLKDTLSDDTLANLYLKDTLLLADVSENFREMCLKIYHLDHAKFYSAPGLAWQAALKKLK